MNNRIRIPLYIVLVLLAGISGYYALTNFGRIMDRAADRNLGVDQIEPERKPALEDSTSSPTNTALAVGTNAAAATNAVGALTNSTAAVTNTNAAATPGTTATTESTVTSAAQTDTEPAEDGGGGGRVGLWLGVFVLSIVLLGLVIANDISHFTGSRALKTLYNDEGEGQKNPEYEEAEQVWANGRHLEAIGLMRDYLKKNPREQYVALRIAEIYEKDLGNYLAAALEYEEVLKHKLPPDRWGWAAIHLCNLYFKLNQEEKGFALLRRLARKHPETAAAEKARKRLQQVDATVDEQIATESNVRVAGTAAKSSEEPASHLPPGFKPKK